MNATLHAFGALFVRRRQGARQGLVLRFRLLFSQITAAILMLLPGPLMLCVAWLTWRRDGAPIFFGRYRVGCDGKLFRCLRFRIMCRNSEQILADLLRDEMSLVGPRPITVAEPKRCGRVRWHYLDERLGLTNLWQVSGRIGTTYEARVALDRRYVEHRTIWLDLKIPFKTIKVWVSRAGAR